MKFLSKIFSFFLVFVLLAPFSITKAESVKLNMVFVPASEKGDDKDYVNLIKIIGELTGIEITPIRVTDYNAAVEAVRANRAQIAWYGGKTYIQAVEI
ncbi:PhnD/SsuA/transferrin family substrate-binding protein, partial [Candidatus Thioglobus sp.]|nr:PhnD/SsuA/transferrin family substrate-binding protein [Candidatus Thioglobus sp.]